MKYAICQIDGKQYKIIPNQALEIDKRDGEESKVKVMLMSENGKVSLGNPFLKNELSLKVLENIKGEKIRVGKYHSKSNYRRVTGQRAQKSKVVWNVKS